MDDRLLCGLPDFGHVVRREGLLRLFRAVSPRLILMVAPGGYGKSVLASQMATAGDFDAVLWLNMRGSSLEQSSMSAALRVCAGFKTGAFPPPGSDAMDELSQVLDRFVGKALCLVLDGVVVGAEATVNIESLLSVMLASTSAHSRLVVTTRELPAQLLTACPDAWVIEAADLRFNVEETRELLAGVLQVPPDQTLTDLIHDTSGGQAALLSILARSGLETSSDARRESASLDLKTHLLRVASVSLPEGSWSTLYAASLLREGSTSELRTAAASDADWSPLVADVLPLFTIRQSDVSFRMHDIACEVFGSEEWASRVRDRERVRARVFQSLADAGREDILVRSLLDSGEPEEMAAWAEAAVSVPLRSVSASMLLNLLARVGQERRRHSPRLLLLEAAALEEREQMDEAIQKAGMARDLADTRGDFATLRDSLIMLGLMFSGRYDFWKAAGCMQSLLALPQEYVSVGMRAMAQARLACFDALVGDYTRAQQETGAALAAVEDAVLPPEEVAYVLFSLSVVEGAVAGRIDRATSMLQRAERLGNLGAGFRVRISGNLADSLRHLARQEEALDVVDGVLDICRRYGMRPSLCGHEGTRAGIIAMSDVEQGVKDLHRSIDGSIALGDHHTAAINLLDLAVLQRASGDSTGSLASVNRALTLLPVNPIMLDSLSSKLELAASRLSLGDVEQAEAVLGPVLQDPQARGLEAHVLRAELLTAVCRLLQGDADAAASLLAGHRDYILTESCNWHIAMYVSAFPVLLGLLAEAVGPMAVPAQVLASIGDGKKRECLEASRGFVDGRRWQQLARRLLGEEEARLGPAGRPDEAPCRVRLFGTFEAWVKHRHVDSKAWSTRKSRLIFAMLVVRRGQDVSRDQILEYLWPGMDEARARNNFYVHWSAMRKALMGETRSACPYVENIGGLCRIASDLVTSDLEEFESQLARARQADAAGDLASALAGYHRVAEIYTGDLLPGDLYDDWFSALRDKCRQEHSDSMLRASRLLDEAGNTQKAIQLLRKALAYDPWREDLYQAALTYQIATGQRSAAVMTYLECRSRLSEDLGLDPSEETQGLYQTVLDMHPEKQAESVDLELPVQL